MFNFLVVLFLASISAQADMTISNDGDDCIDGWLTMDIFVHFSEESFEFDPACNSSFNKSFKLKSGEVCNIEAGMCSSFEPKNRFIVTCKNGETTKVDIKCRLR